MPTVLTVVAVIRPRSHLHQGKNQGERGGEHGLQPVAAHTLRPATGPQVRAVLLPGFLATIR